MEDGSLRPWSRSGQNAQAEVDNARGGWFASDVDAPRLSEAVPPNLERRPSAADSLFLADLCHQVRTPLNGILGTLELLLQNELSDEAYELARVAYDSAVALHRVFEADLIDAIQDSA